MIGTTISMDFFGSGTKVVGIIYIISQLAVYTTYILPFDIFYLMALTT